MPEIVPEMPLLAGCIFSLQGFVLTGATGPPWWPYEATGWKVWDDYSFSRLVGKLKLMARKVVEPIMAVLTLRSSPPWIEMPRAQVSHPQLQRGLLPHGGERLPLESVYGVCVCGGGVSSSHSLKLLHPSSYHLPQSWKAGP